MEVEMVEEEEVEEKVEEEVEEEEENVDVEEEKVEVKEEEAVEEGVEEEVVEEEEEEAFFFSFRPSPPSVRWWQAAKGCRRCGAMPRSHAGSLPRC